MASSGAAKDEIELDLEKFVDIDMDKVYEEYPVRFIPIKFHPRTGKAKKSLYEAIDNDLYLKEPHMVTFHTTPSRVYPWIKALDIFYFQHLGQSHNLEVRWFDTPERWTVANNNNAIVIELLDKSDNMKLLYNVTFFVTTGTIRVQGSKYKTFVEKHFDKLKEVLQKVLEVYVPVNRHDTELTEEAHITSTEETHDSASELDDTSEDLRSNHDDSVTSLKGVLTLDKTVVHVSETSLSNLEDSVTEAVKKLELYRKDDEDKLESVKQDILNAVDKLEKSQAEGNKKIILELNGKMDKLQLSSTQKHPSADTSEVSMLQSRIGVLEVEKQDLDIQVKQHKANFEQASLQHDEVVKQKAKMLADCNRQYNQIEKTLSLEREFLQNKLTKKDEEIESLQNRNRILASKLDEAQDQIIELKSQIGSASSSDSSGFKTVGLHVAAKSPSKPWALLIGTSNLKHINEEKLTDAAIVTKVIQYTLKEAEEYLSTLAVEASPDIVILHVFTNDVKQCDPKLYMNDLDSLLSLIRTKWQNVHVIISLCTPRLDDLSYQTNAQILNVLVKQKIMSQPGSKITYCEHNNMLLGGNPNKELLGDDKIHLSSKGVSYLAGNLKKSIHGALQIPLPTSHRPDRSRSRNRRGRGRGGPFPR